MNDGVITSGNATEATGKNQNNNYDLFDTENPMDDENSDEDVPDELKREFVEEEDEYQSVYDGIKGAPNHTSTPRR